MATKTLQYTFTVELPETGFSETSDRIIGGIIDTIDPLIKDGTARLVSGIAIDEP